MLSYRPPLRDIAFVLDELLDAERTLAALPRHAGLARGTLLDIAAAFAPFAREQVLPLNAGADAAGCRWQAGQVRTPPGFAEAYRQWADLGWPALCAREEEGGQGLPQLAFSLVAEIVSAASHAFAMAAGINHCAMACLRQAGSAALRRTWLPRLASGEVLASMCMSEPQAGSDLGLLRTRAEPAADGSHRITGGKVFASGAEHDLTANIAHLVLARLPDAPAGSRGLSLFLVPKLLEGGRRNAVQCDGIEHKMGLHGSPTCSMRFDGATGWLIGEPNRGLQAMFHMMNEARLLTGAQALGLSEIALQNALAYSRERRQGRSATGGSAALVEHADVQRMLLAQKAWTEGGRALTLWAGLLVDEAAEHPEATHRAEAATLLGLLTPLVKAFVSENAQLSLGDALQVHGGHGYIAETGIEQLVRDARVTTIYEGTTGIQAQDLLLRKAGTGLPLLVARVRAWLASAAGEPALAAFSGPLVRLCDDVVAVTAELVGEGTRRPGARPEGVATAHLRLVGHLVVAWLWARAAQRCLAADSPFHRAKLATARFHFSHLLPETAALLAVLRSDWVALDDALADV